MTICRISSYRDVVDSLCGKYRLVTDNQINTILPSLLDVTRFFDGVYRFGLYGAPLDPVLFDVGPPHLVKTGASPASTPNSTSLCGTSAAAATATTTSTATATTVGHDEVDLRDLLSINASEKTGRSQMNHIQQHTCGLLEVEPLHFVCHATSDGTRMERMDAGQSAAKVTHDFNVGQLKYKQFFTGMRVF